MTEWVVAISVSIAALSSALASSLSLLNSSFASKQNSRNSSYSLTIKPQISQSTVSPKVSDSKIETSGPGSPGGGSGKPLAAATSKFQDVTAYPVTDRTKVYTVRASYYGPDRINGVHGGNDNIFEHIPAGQYTATQLRQIGKNFCAMTEKFLKKGFMGAIIRVTGVKASLDMVVVDLLPDRHDGKGVEIDVHDQKAWLALGGDEAVGIQQVNFKVVGRASIPVPSNSPWDPKKFGF